MNRQVPCANNRTNGCQEIVSQRGTIFCETCSEERKNLTKSRREQDIDDLVNKNAELEKELMRLRQVQHTIENSNSKNKDEYEKKILDLELEIKSLQIDRNEIENNYTKILTENKVIQQLNEDFSKNNKQLQEMNLELEKTVAFLKKNQDENSRYATMYKTQIEKENVKLQDLLSKLRIDNQNLVKEREIYEMSYSQLKIDSQKISLDNKKLKEQNAKLLSQNEELTKDKPNALQTKPIAPVRTVLKKAK